MHLARVLGLLGCAINITKWSQTLEGLLFKFLCKDSGKGRGLLRSDGVAMENAVVPGILHAGVLQLTRKKGTGSEISVCILGNKRKLNLTMNDLGSQEPLHLQHRYIIEPFMKTFLHRETKTDGNFPSLSFKRAVSKT